MFTKLRIPKATMYLLWPILTSLKWETFPCTPGEPVTVSCNRGVSQSNRSADICLAQPSQWSCEKGRIIYSSFPEEKRQARAEWVRERGPAGMQNTSFPNGSASPPFCYVL